MAHTHASVRALARHLEACHPSRIPVTFLEELAKVQQVFSTHAEFLAHYKKVDTDFVYDKISNRYLVGTTGKHVDLMAALYRYYGGTEPSDHDAADQYILGGLGMFKSRAGNRIYRGYTFKVPTELSSIQRDIEVLG